MENPNSVPATGVTQFGGFRIIVLSLRYMIGWIYSDPENVGLRDWCNERGEKMLCVSVRPANPAKRSGFVNYGIERGQSFNNEVIRVTRSVFRPS